MTYPAPSQVALLNSAVSSFVGRWWLAMTRPNYEMSLVGELAARGVSYFAPIEKIKRRSPNGTRRIVDVPLFSNYVFLNGDESDRSIAAHSRATVRVIEVANQRMLQRQLESFDIMVSNGVSFAASPLSVGDRCRVIAGPMINCEGLLVSHKGNHRLVVEITILGSLRETEVDPDVVEKIS